MREIEREPQALTPLAKKLSLTVQEASRHLLRLDDGGLVRKDDGGRYRLTPLGTSVMRLVPAYEFLSQRREYFLAHDVSFLPAGFLERIGDLTDHEFLEHTASILDSCLQLAREAVHYIWFILDKPLPAVFAGTGRANVTVRGIVPRRLRADARAAAGALGSNVELGVLDEIRVGLALNEKVADVCFPDVAGKIDFGCGFMGKGERFHGWCRDLFAHYWEASRKV